MGPGHWFYLYTFVVHNHLNELRTFLSETHEEKCYSYKIVLFCTHTQEGCQQTIFLIFYRLHFVSPSNLSVNIMVSGCELEAAARVITPKPTGKTCNVNH